MTYIHQKPDWPAFRWDAHALVASLAHVRHRQGRLLGQMQLLGFECQSRTSLEALTSDIVKSSAIEGETLSPDHVRSSIARRLGIDAGGTPPPRAPREVEGFVETLLDATHHHDAPLTSARLFNWHAAIFPTGRNGIRRITVGAWRTKESGPMQVVSGPIGKERVHFEAPDASRLDSEMSRFLKWFNTPPTNPPNPLNPLNSPIDPVLKAAIAHFWFVTIHPFDDGNGRIARVIADMALARADACPQRFYSMSAQIEAERDEYYRRLESAQRGPLDITRWLEWFLACLDRAIAKAETTLDDARSRVDLWRRANNFPLNERQRTVINKLLDGFEGLLTTSKYAKLAKCSPDTALRDIQALIEHGVLVQNPARGRSTSYQLASPHGHA